MDKLLICIIGMFLIGIVFGFLISGAYWYEKECDKKEIYDIANKCLDDLNETLDEQDTIREVFEGFSNDMVCEDGECWFNNSIWIEGEGICYKTAGRIICPV